MPGTTFRSDQVIREWGNGLGLRLPAGAAKAAHLSPGTPVSVEVTVEGDIIVKARARMSLAQKLEQYDPQRHGGEVADGGLVGAERF